MFRTGAGGQLAAADGGAEVVENARVQPGLGRGVLGGRGPWGGLIHA